MRTPQWSSTLCIIFLDTAYARVLAVPDATGWRLPTFQLDERLYIADAAHVNRIAVRELNVPVTVLYCADAHINRVEHWVHSYYVLGKAASVLVSAHMRLP